MQTEVQFADGSNGAMLAVETSRGWFVDWLSFTGAGDLTVAEFLEKKPPQSTLLLVMAQQDSYYNGAYPSAATHQCLRLTNRDGTHVFYGYLSVENSAAAMVKDLPVFQRGAPPGQDRRPLAVRATFTSAAGKEQNQAEILLIAGEGWFVP